MSTLEDYQEQERKKAKTYTDRYAAEARTERDTVNAEIDRTYNDNVAYTTASYESAKKETTASYHSLYDANAVDELVRKREINETLSNMGLGQSGLLTGFQGGIQRQRQYNDRRVTEHKRESMRSLDDQYTAAMKEYDTWRDTTKQNVSDTVENAIADVERQNNKTADAEALRLYNEDQQAARWEIEAPTISISASESQEEQIDPVDELLGKVATALTHKDARTGMTEAWNAVIDAYKNGKITLTQMNDIMREYGILSPSQQEYYISREGDFRYELPISAEELQQIAKTERSTEITSSIDEAFVNDIFADHNALAENFQTLGYDNAAEVTEEAVAMSLDLQKRAAKALSFLEENRALFTEEDYTALKTALENVVQTQEQIREAYKSFADTVSGYATKEEYEKAIEVESIYRMSLEQVDAKLEELAHNDDVVKSAEHLLAQHNAWYAKADTPDFADLRELAMIEDSLSALLKPYGITLEEFKGDDQYAVKAVEELRRTVKEQRIAYTTEDGKEVKWEDVHAAKMYEETTGSKVKAVHAMTVDELGAKLNEINEAKETAKPLEAKIKAIDSEINSISNTARNPKVKARLQELNNQKRALQDRINSMIPSSVAYTTLDGKNVTWQQLYDAKAHEEMVAQTLKQLQQNEDWKEKSGYDDTVAKATNPLYYAANIPQEQKEKWSETDVKVGVAAYLKGIIGPINAVNSVALTKLYDAATINVFLSDDERRIYNYLYTTKGMREAEEWKRSFLSVLEDRRMTGTLTTLTDFTQKNAATATIASVASVPASLLSAVEYVGDALKYIVTGDMDTNSLSQVANTIRGAVTEKYDWEIEALNDWDAFDFLYNTGMSMADSVATLPIGGWGSAAILGMSAAASATNAALERGLDDRHAFWGGVAAGAFEMIFEKVSIGQFESMKDGITKGLKDAVKNLAKSMVVNMTEETATEIANILYDNLANGELSAYETSIRAKMAQGVSKEDAVRQASLELGQRVTEAAASGALMGIGMGAGGSAVSYDKTNKIGSTIKANNAANAVIDLGKTMDQSSRSYVLAMELDGKETVTDAQLGELFLTIAEESQGKWNVDSAGGGVLDVPTQTSTKSDATSPYNAAPMPDLSNITDLDIRTHEMLAAQAPARASVVDSNTKLPTVNTPKSTPTQSNGGGGDPDAPQQTTTQTSVDPELSNIIEAATAGVEGRVPNLLLQQPTASATEASLAKPAVKSETASSISADPTVAELTEAFKAGAEGRRYVPKEHNNLTYKMGVNADASETTGWSAVKAKTVSKKEKEAIIAYSKSKGVNMVDISKFDGDTDLLKAEIDSLSNLLTDYGLTDRKTTLSVAEMSDDDFAVTRNTTIILNAKVLRHREFTESVLRSQKGVFASTKVEDIVAHEFGHVVSSIVGNKGVDIAQQAYYNVYGDMLSVDEVLSYLQNNISEYAVTYLGIGRKRSNDLKKYQEIIPEVLAKHNSSETQFTKEFVAILKRGML